MPVSCLTGHQAANTLLTGNNLHATNKNIVPRRPYRAQRSAIPQTVSSAVMDAPAQKASLASVSTLVHPDRWNRNALNCALRQDARSIQCLTQLASDSCHWKKNWRPNDRTDTPSALLQGAHGRVFNFSAGPATLPVPVLEQTQADLINYQGSGMSVMEMSHRGPEFTRIIEEAEADLRQLMAIPDNYKVLFLQGGASQQFSAIPFNLTQPDDVVDYVSATPPCPAPSGRAMCLHEKAILTEAMHQLWRIEMHLCLIPLKTSVAQS